eukprot:5901148-Pyramimonas_sp.AAC.1
MPSSISASIAALRESTPLTPMRCLTMSKALYTPTLRTFMTSCKRESNMVDCVSKPIALAMSSTAPAPRAQRASRAASCMSGSGAPVSTIAMPRQGALK